MSACLQRRAAALARQVVEPEVTVALESARIDDTYSYRFMKWMWLELSAVTVPANSEASANVRSSAFLPK